MRCPDNTYDAMQKSLDILRFYCHEAILYSDHKDHVNSLQEAMVRAMVKKHECFYAFADYFAEAFCQVWNMYEGRKIGSETFTDWQFDILSENINLRIRKCLKDEGYDERAFKPFAYRVNISSIADHFSITLCCHFKHRNNIDMGALKHAVGFQLAHYIDKVMYLDEIEAEYLLENSFLLDSMGCMNHINYNDLQRCITIPESEALNLNHNLLIEEAAYAAKVQQLQRILENLDPESEPAKHIMSCINLEDGEQTKAYDIDVGVTFYELSKYKHEYRELIDLLDEIKECTEQYNDCSKHLAQLDLMWDETRYFRDVKQNIRYEQDEVSYRFYMV